MTVDSILGCSSAVVPSTDESVISVHTGNNADSVSSTDCKVDQSDGDKDAHDSCSTHCRCHHKDLMTDENINKLVSTECEAARCNNTAHLTAETARVHSKSSTCDRSSQHRGDIHTFMTRDQPHGDSSAADVAEKAKSSVCLFEPDSPVFDCIQRHSFTDSSTFDVVDADDDTADATETDVCASGLRSDFDRHCAPLKLISQLDGAIPDSDSEASGEESGVMTGCGDILSRSLVAPVCRQFGPDNGLSSPFKCLRCKRVYRTEESCILHSAICTFELSSGGSSSSGSEKSYDDKDEALEPSDEETDTCCSDEGDDGVISDYLTSSRSVETMANCSSLGCQTENVFVASEDCDMNANCKVLYRSNAETEHCRLKPADFSDSLNDEIENETCASSTESYSSMQHRSQNKVHETVLTCRTSRVVETEEICPITTCISAVDDCDENEKVRDLDSDTLASDGHFTESDSVQHHSVVCCNEHAASESMQSQTTCRPSVCGLESAPCYGASVVHSEASHGGTNNTGMQCALVKMTLHSDVNCVDSKAADADHRITSSYEAAVNAVSASLSVDQQSPLTVNSNKSTEASINISCTAAPPAFSSCTSSSVLGDQSDALGLLSTTASTGFPWQLGHVTGSSAACVPSPQQYVMRPQDMLTSSASLVWPSATVSPSIVSNGSRLSETGSSGTRTRLLVAPWIPVGMVSTVIPTALPNAAGTRWIRPMNIAQPLYAIGQSHVQSPGLSQPVQLIQQVVRPAILAPVMWLAPQLSLMTAVNLHQPLTLHPTAVSAELSTCLSSQQSALSTLATDVLSTSQQPVLSQHQGSASGESPQKTVSSTGIHAGTQMSPGYPRVSRSQPSAVASVSLCPLSVCRSTPSSHQSSHQLVLTTLSSQQAALPPTVAVAPQLCSTLSPSPTSTLVKRQLQFDCSPLASLTRHVSSITSSPFAVSKYNLSAGVMSVTQSSSTTPMTVSSQSGCFYEKTRDVLTVSGSNNLQATCRMQAGVKSDVAVTAKGRTISPWQTPRLNSSLSVHTEVISTACCLNPTTSQTSGTEHFLLSTAVNVPKSQPVCLSELSASFVPSSHCPLSVPAVTMNSRSSGTRTAATNGVLSVGNSAKSPRLIIQPSSIAVGTESEILKLAQSVYKLQPYTVAHLTPVTTSKPTSATARSQTCDVEFVDSNCSAVYSQLGEDTGTSSSDCCDVVPLPWTVSGSQQLSDSVGDEQISSPVNNTESKSSAGKCNLMLSVDC